MVTLKHNAKYDKVIQLYWFLPSNSKEAISTLQHCLTSMSCLKDVKLKLNPARSEILLMDSGIEMRPHCSRWNSIPSKWTFLHFGRAPWSSSVTEYTKAVLYNYDWCVIGYNQLDYFNAILKKCHKIAIDAECIRNRCFIMPVLKDLHWLLVPFQMLVFTFKALNFS